MNRFRRATTFTLTLLLIQLVLVGSGFTCVGGEQDVGTAMATTGMADMPGMSMDGPMHTDAGGLSSRSPESDSTPCDLPWAPSGCTLMIPCGPHAVTPQVQTIASRQTVNHADVTRKVATPASAIIALDTPPPRA